MCRMHHHNFPHCFYILNPPFDINKFVTCTANKIHCDKNPRPAPLTNKDFLKPEDEQNYSRAKKQSTHTEVEFSNGKLLQDMNGQ